jgi:hypothetical protein
MTVSRWKLGKQSGGASGDLHIAISFTAPPLFFYIICALPSFPRKRESACPAQAGNHITLPRGAV